MLSHPSPCVAIPLLERYLVKTALIFPPCIDGYYTMRSIPRFRVRFMRFVTINFRRTRPGGRRRSIRNHDEFVSRHVSVSSRCTKSISSAYFIPTACKMFWDPYLDQLSSVVGAPPSQIKTVSILLLSYPLSSLFVRLPASRPNLSHVFSLVVSFFYLGPVLGLHSGMVHLLFSSFGTYFLANTIKGPSMPWVVFA